MHLSRIRGGETRASRQAFNSIAQAALLTTWTHSLDSTVCLKAPFFTGHRQQVTAVEPPPKDALVNP